MTSRGYPPRNWPVIVVGAVWLAWTIPALLKQAPDKLGGAFAASLLAFLFGLAVVLVFYAASTALAPSKRLARNVTAYALGGASAAASLQLLGQALSVPDSLSLGERLLLSVLAAVWGLSSVDALTATYIRLQSEREDLSRQEATIAIASVSQAVLIAELRASIITAVEAELESARTDVRKQLELLESANDDSIWERTPSMRDVADASIRPLAHLLDESASVVSQRIGLWEFLRAIPSTQPFWPLPLAALYVLGVLPEYWNEFGAPTALIMIGTGIVYIFAILGGANALMRRFPARHSVIFAIGLAVLQVPTSIFNIATSTQSAGVVTLEVTATMLVSVVAVFITSGVGSWRTRNELALQVSRERLDASLNQAIQRAHISGLVARDAARVLHGPVQARLSACAMAIDAAVAARDIPAYSAALAQAQNVLGSPFDQPSPVHEEISIREMLEDLASLWRGLVDVNVVVDLATDQAENATPQANLALSRICEEAITNAVRHGSATSVHVDVCAEKGHFTITVVDNGKGPGPGAPGLGATMIDDLTGGSWELLSGASGGSVLRATVS